MRQFEGTRSASLPTDRNPLTVMGIYNGTAVAPHAQTNRYTYTVPASRRTLVVAHYMQHVRLTAAAPVGLVTAFTRLVNAAAATSRLMDISMLTNGVGDRVSESLAIQQTMLATELTDAYTIDASTGGTMNSFISFSGTEYDA